MRNVIFTLAIVALVSIMTGCGATQGSDTGIAVDPVAEAAKAYKTYYYGNFGTFPSEMQIELHLEGLDL